MVPFGGSMCRYWPPITFPYSVFNGITGARYSGICWFIRKEEDLVYGHIEYSDFMSDTVINGPPIFLYNSTWLSIKEAMSIWNLILGLAKSREHEETVATHTFLTHPGSGNGCSALFSCISSPRVCFSNSLIWSLSNITIINHGNGLIQLQNPYVSVLWMHFLNSFHDCLLSLCDASKHVQK